jgi:hypothetical protein
MRVPFSMPRTRPLGVAGAVFAGVFAFAEAAHWRSSHKRLGDHDVASGGRRPWSDPRSSPWHRGTLTSEGRQRSDHRRPRIRQPRESDRTESTGSVPAPVCARSIRWRVRPSSSSAGAPSRARTPEAPSSNASPERNSATPADHWLEDQSTTTWENIANAIPLIDRELTPIHDDQHRLELPPCGESP